MSRSQWFVFSHHLLATVGSLQKSWSVPVSPYFQKKYLSKTILNQSLDYWTVDAVSAHSSSCKVNDVNHTNTIHSHQNWFAVKNYFSSSKLFQVIICGTSMRTRPGWSQHEEEDWDFTGEMSRFPQPMTWSSSRNLQTTVITTLQLDLWVRIGF